MARLCTCERYRPGESFVLHRDCRLCWLYHNDPRYRTLWGGEPLPVQESQLMPSLLQRTKSFAQASLEYVRQGLPQVSEEEYQRRISICQTCEFLQADYCMKCGCKVIGKVLTKARWGSEHCPINRW